MAIRAPHLHLTLRGFCLGAFVFLGRALEDGDELPFAFEEHVQRGGPALYEYRPLVRSFVESRASALAERDDARIALDELLREPAAAIFARAHAGPRASEEDALFRTILVSLLIAVAESCGGFDWDDLAFERAYAELERSLFGSARAYAAVAPLLGISVVTQVELGEGLRIRAAATGELAHHWPEAQGLLPPGFGHDIDRYCVLELERALEAGAEPPDAPAELADAVSALRLATGAPVALGPVLFERLDWRPFGIRPALPIAGTQPLGEPSRLDSFRAEVVREVLGRLSLADGDPALAEALDRWELSLFQNEPFRSEQLRAAAAALLGETWELRAAVLLGAESEERRAIHASLRALANGEPASKRAEASVRRALVAGLRHGNRVALIRTLDDVLLGLRTAPGSRRPRSARSIRDAFVTKALLSRRRAPASVVVMEATEAVLARLDRIGTLDRSGAAPGELLGELRGLLREAEACARETGNAEHDREEVVGRQRTACARDIIDNE